MADIFKSNWITTEEFAALSPDDLILRPDGNNKKGEIFNRHICFKKSFNFSGGEAILNISADDYYKLYINGEFVGQGPAPAYFYNYKYNQYNLTGRLKSGLNTIAVHTYYDGNVNRVWNSGDQRFGLVADLFIDGLYAFGTDSGWKYKRMEEFTSTTTVGYNTAFLDDMDMRLRDGEIFGSDFIGEWQNAVEINPDYTFCETPVPTLQIYKVAPKIQEYRGDHFFIDMGKEYAGSLYMELKGAEGEEVKILSAEEILPDGRLPKAMRCNCEYLERVILSGKSDHYMPFGYKGFRYAEIYCRQEVVKSLYLVAQNHHFPENAAVLECENTLLADIFDLCLHTLRVGTQEGILDCIQREKGQYLGDFTVSGLAYLYATGDVEFYKKVLQDFADTARINKGLLAVAPGSLHQEIADFSLQYPLQIMNYYNYTGDKAEVCRLLPIAEGILEHFQKFRRPDGMLKGVTDKWNLVDWPDNLRDGYDCELCNPIAEDCVHNVINAFYVGAVKTTEQLRDIAGVRYLSEYEKLKAAYINAFFDKEAGLFKDTEQSHHHSLHSNVVAAYYGLNPEGAAENIIKLISEKQLCCGVQMSYFLLKALAVLGAYDKLLELLLNQGEHSWANMLREGATTTLEAWGKDQKFNTSFCHPWATAPIILLAEHISQLPLGCNYKLTLPGRKTIKNP